MSYAIYHYVKLSVYNSLQSKSYGNNSVNSRTSFVFTNNEVKRIMNHFVMAKILKVLPLEPSHIKNGLVKRKEVFITTNIVINDIKNLIFICINFSGSQIPLSFCKNFLLISFSTPTFTRLNSSTREIINPTIFNSLLSCFTYEQSLESEFQSTFPSDYPHHKKCYIINGPICSFIKEGTLISYDFLYKFQGTNDFPRNSISDKVMKFYNNSKYFTTYALHCYSQFNHRLVYYRQLVEKTNSKTSKGNYHYNLDVFNHVNSQRAFLRFTIIRKLESDCLVVQIISQEFFIGKGLLKYPNSAKHYNPRIHLATRPEIHDNTFYDVTDNEF